MDWSSIDWNYAGNGLLLAIVSVLAWFGKRTAEGKPPVPGVTQAPSNPAQPGGGVSPAVEINALVDSRALNSHTAAIEAMNLTLMSGLKLHRELAEAQAKSDAQLREQHLKLAETLIESMEELTKHIRGVGYALDHTTASITGLQKEVRDNTIEHIRKG